MTSLTKNDLRFVVQRLPRDIRDLLTQHHGNLFVGGGVIRAIVAGEEPKDIDLFGADAGKLHLIAELFAKDRPGARVHTSKNAITVITPNRLPVQFITRWTFSKGYELLRSFDFTVCQAVVWRSGNQSNSRWESARGDSFYVDLAGRRLVYTNPVREEEAGGSLLRVLKYVKRGYSIQVSSMVDVIGRLTTAMETEPRLKGLPRAAALDILLREVDPMLVVDGFDVVDDHEPIEGE
jgi:hypothetical protein